MNRNTSGKASGGKLNYRILLESLFLFFFFLAIFFSSILTNIEVAKPLGIKQDGGGRGWNKIQV